MTSIRSIVRSIVIVLVVCLFAVTPVVADCGVLYLDGPGCTPCPFIATGSVFGFYVDFFSDGSSAFVSGHYESNCDGEVRRVTDHAVASCPNGYPCMASDWVTAYLASNP